MSSTILEPVPPGSIDRLGLSSCTATRDGTPRVGTIWLPRSFAAATPVHFHPLGGNLFLGLFDGYWHTAAPSLTDAGHYVSHTEVPGPVAALIDAQVGTISPVTGQDSYALSVSARPGLKLVSASSSFTQLATLCTTDTLPVLGFWTTTVDNQLQSRGEFVVPTITADGQDVLFDAGVYIDKPWIYLWGRGLEDGRVYTARHNISLLGTDRWLYQTADGWVDVSALFDADNPRPATPVSGLSTEGPMSTVVLNGNTYVTTVATDGDDKVGQIWASKSMADPWRKVTETVIDTGATWTGNGLMLQPQVPPNDTEVGATAAVPWVKTTYDDTEDNEALTVSWGIFAVPRL